MRLITITGSSGAGKDTVARLLALMPDFEVICSYTTRPMREGEEEGREHHFVKSCKVSKQDMLAYTQYGGYEYWTEKSQLHDNAIYVIDEKGLVKLCENFPDIELINIYVAASSSTLETRGISKERQARDHDRYHLDINDYNFVIPNNGTMRDLQDFVSLVAVKLCKICGVPPFSNSFITY